MCHAFGMPKTIQVRGVPDSVHRTLKSRAVSEGMSLARLIRRELEHLAERPSMQEWLERTRRLKPVPAGQTAAHLSRQLRDKR